jgi:uncharacterized protein (TIGR03435 family)
MKNRLFGILIILVIAVCVGWLWMTFLRKPTPPPEEAPMTYQPVDDSVWLNLDRRRSDKYREGLRSAPPTLIVRQTHYTFSPTNGVGMHYGWIDGKMANLVISFSELVSYAYSDEAVWDGTLMARTEMPDGWKNGHLTNKFDVIVTVTNRPKEALQAEIKKQLKQQFGLSWHREKKDTEVLAIRVKDPQLLASKASDVFSESKSIPEFFSELENFFGKPVVNETGATNRYEKSLELVPARWVNGRTTDLPANNDHLARYGLELVATNQTTEWLIMEH